MFFVIEKLIINDLSKSNLIFYILSIKNFLKIKNELSHKIDIKLYNNLISIDNKVFLYWKTWEKYAFSKKSIV